MLWGEEWGGFWGDAIAWLDREDNTDPSTPYLPILPGDLDTIRTATERLWKQFEGEPTWEALLTALGDASQDLERVLGDLLPELYVRWARGWWLEQIGADVGRARGGQSEDDEYRLAIVAEALSQVAECTGPETIDLAIRLAPEGSDVLYQEHYPLGFLLTIPDLPPGRFALMREIMADAVANTVGAALETYPTTPGTPGVPGEAAVAGWDYTGAPGFVVGTSSPPVQRREYDEASQLAQPVFADLSDPVGGGTGTNVGSVYDATTDTRQFDGVDDRVSYPNIVDMGTVPRPHSGVCWIRPDSVGAGLFVIFTNSNTVPQQSVIFRRNADGIEFSHAYSVTSLRRVSGSVLAVGRWTMAGWSYDGSGLAAGIHLYIDGVEVSSYVTNDNSSGTPRAANGLWTWGGRDDLAANMFAGRIGLGRIYDGVLPASAFRRIHQLNIIGGVVEPFGAFDYTSGTDDDDVNALWSYAAEIGS